MFFFFFWITDEPGTNEPRVIDDDGRPQRYASKWRKITQVNLNK